MPDYDRGFKIIARQASPGLGQMPNVPTDELQPIGDTVQVTERLADRAFRGRRGRERFVVYFEAYTRWQSSAPWSLLAKSGLLSERERLPTVSVVFILLPRGYRAQAGQFRLQALAGPTQHIWFREVCLWQEEPQPWWEEWPGLMALYPLCRHHRRHDQAVAYAAQAIEARTRDRVARADLLTTLAIFGKLAYPQLDVLSLIGREQMKESKFFEEVLAEGREEGLQRGREEGRQEGQRELLATLLQERFGRLSKPVRQRLHSLSGRDLAQLGRDLLKAQSLGDLGLE
jgi:hypothetical protein